MNTTRGLVNWSAWIAVFTAIYCVLYVLSPLGKYGLMWATFVALPIYFITGAPRKEFWNFFLCYPIGVGWGIVYLWLIDVLSGVMEPNLGFTLGVLIVTFVLVAIHLAFLRNTPLNKVPAVFGGISTCFSTGGTNAVPLIITLLLGCSLAVLLAYGGELLTEDGRWKLFAKNKKI